MSNCIDCLKLKNTNGNKCICNSEQRCATCNNCIWCIDNHENGKCVNDYDFNKKNCPYSFIDVSNRHHNSKYKPYINYNNIGYITKEKIYNPENNKFDLILLLIFSVMFIILIVALYSKRN